MTKSVFNNRRSRILRYALIKRTIGGSFSSFIKNTLGPTCTVLAASHIAKTQESQDTNIFWFKTHAEPLFFPTNVDKRALYQTVTEQFYPWNWHYYEVPETTVENDVVFDCGAAEGLFTFLVHKRAKQVFCFEPLPEFQQCLQKTFHEAKNITIISAALADKPGLAYLSKDGIASYLTTEKTPDQVIVETIDRFCEAKNIQPSYIKADLEGYEIQLLEGAKETIKKCKPKLAITTYHNAKDAENLIQLLKSLRPDYLFKLKGIEDRRGDPVMLHAW